MVEDDQVNRLLMVRALHRDNWETLAVTNGLEAVTIFREFQPDLVITDLLMPGMDGKLLVRQLRDAGFEGPIVLVTAVDLDNPGHPKHIPGVTFHMQKPLGVSRLRRVVKQLLRGIKGM